MISAENRKHFCSFSEYLKSRKVSIANLLDVEVVGKPMKSLGFSEDQRLNKMLWKIGIIWRVISGFQLLRLSLKILENFYVAFSKFILFSAFLDRCYGYFLINCKKVKGQFERISVIKTFFREVGEFLCCFWKIHIFSSFLMKILFILRFF